MGNKTSKTTTDDKIKESKWIMSGNRFYNEFPSNNENCDKLLDGIDGIVSGYKFTIYFNHKLQKYLVAGFNYPCAYHPSRAHYSYQDRDNAMLKKFAPEKITYFERNNIKIRNVYTNINSQCIFWETDHGLIYAQGNNEKGQLGVYKNWRKTVIIPEFELEHVIDIKSNARCSIAICAGFTRNKSNKIVHGFCPKSGRVPIDIIHIILTFLFEPGKDKNRLFLTVKSKWTCIEEFSDPEIIKIDCQFQDLYLLQSDGDLLKAVYNKTTEFFESEVMAHNVIDFACGYNQTLVVDSDGNVICYTGKYCVYKEKIYPFDAMEHKVDSIQCGRAHFLVITQNGDYYMWGDNGYKDCLAVLKIEFGINRKTAYKVIPKKDATLISAVSLGCRNTKLLFKKTIKYQFSRQIIFVS